MHFSVILVHSTLKEILAALDDKLSSEDLDGMIGEIDSDGSGTVDFDGELGMGEKAIYREIYRDIFGI